MSPSSDMKMEKSAISKYFSRKSVLITGGTGFLGTVLIETLLRRCESIKNIYVLIRPKKGLSPEERLAAITRCEIFDWAREKNFELLSKIVVVNGDISSKGLALSSSDYNMITENVSIIMHCAARINLDVALLAALKNHVYGTNNILQLAKDCRNLEVLTYVSTAYSNCNQDKISEVIYKTPKTASEILELMNTLTEDEFDKITPSLMEGFPNTYVFSKAVTENLLQENQDEMPIAIIRPSIILGLSEGNMKGWIHGWAVFPLAMLLHSMGINFNVNMNPNHYVDIIPVDYVANAIIAASWYTSNNWNNEVAVYNILSSSVNPITWMQFAVSFHEAVLSYPPKDVVWYPYKKLDFSKSSTFSLNQFFENKELASFLDFSLQSIGQKPRFLKYIRMIVGLSKTMNFLNSKKIMFSSSKASDLYKSLTPSDQELFYFDVSNIEWDNYIKTFYLGMRQFLLRDDLTTIDEAKLKLRRLYWLHQMTKLTGLAYSSYLAVKSYSLISRI